MLKFPNEIYWKALEEVMLKSIGLQKGQYKIEMENGSAKGLNYNGVIYRIKITTSDCRQLSLIAKLPTENQSKREEFLIHKTFVQECDFYWHFQEEKGINVQKDGFNEVPICYKTLWDDPLEGIFFEDLKVKGFEMFDQKMQLSNHHIKLAPKALAKMHACYFAIKDQKPYLVEKYKTIEDYHLKQCRQKEAATKVVFHKFKMQAVDAILKHNNKKLVEHVKKVLQLELHQLLEVATEVEATEPFAILCHCDCWINNIMYKCDENGNPTECKLIDHTLMRYASQVTDLFFILFPSTTKRQRAFYFKEYLEVYHETFSTFLKRLGSNPQEVFPRDIFEAHLKQFGKFGLAMSIILVPLITSDEGDVTELDVIAEAFKEDKDKFADFINFVTPKTVKDYEERMLEIIEDLYEYGYI